MQNKYEVLGVVGEGAYGIVYKCRNKETNEFVAIKKFKETNDDLVKKTMKRELKVLQLLKHENIVEFKEAFKRKGNLFLVFEFVEKNLLELLETFPSGLDQKLIKNLIYQLCKSVIYLHENNIIHRDIKPENLLITSDFQLKLCDFGFARNFNRSKNEHLTDYVATRWYRSPELLISNGSYGPEVDFWAIGCIMGELSDGNPLFPGENETDQLHCIQKVLGNFTEEQKEMFYNNPLYHGCTLLDIQKPETLERRYMGKMSKKSILFMKRLLEVDPKKRIKGVEVLLDPYFRGVVKKSDITFLKSDITFLKSDITFLDESRNVSENKKKDFMRSLSNKIIHDNNNNNVANTNREKKIKKNSDEKNNMNNTTTNINIINYNLINTSINSNNFSLNNFNLSNNNNNKNFDNKNSPKNLNKFSMFLQKEKNSNENKNKEKIFKKMAMTMTNKMFIKKFNNKNYDENNNNNNNNNNESLNLSNRQSLENNTTFNFNNNKPNLNFSFFNLIANNPNRTFFKNNNFNFNFNNKKLDKYNYNINTNFSKFNNNNNNNNFYSMKKKNNHQSILEEVEEITESQINENNNNKIFNENNKIFNENELRKSKSLQEFKKMNKAKKIFNKNLSKSPFRNNNNNFYGFSFYNMNFKYKDKTNYIKKNKNYGIFLPSLKRNLMKKN